MKCESYTCPLNRAPTRQGAGGIATGWHFSGGGTFGEKKEKQMVFHE